MNRPPPTHSRATELLRGLTALAVLMLLLVGLPAGLLVVSGSPIPRTLPGWDKITTTLMQPDTSDALFLSLVKLIGWAAWGLFTLITLIEALSYRRRSPSRQLPRPVRPMQHLARDLVAMIALIIGTATPIATSTTSPAPQPIATTRPIADFSPTPAHQLGEHDQAVLPTVRSSSAVDHPWRTRLIKRGDTLWAIARRAYGTGTRYHVIFNASKHLEQPHGLPRLTDPDQIYPGQRITLPRAAARSNRLETPARPDRPPRTPPPQHSAPTGHPAGQPGTTSHPTSVNGTPPPTWPTTPSPSATPRTSTSASPQQVPPASEPSEPRHGTPVTVRLPTGAYIGLGLCAAISLALAATRIYRRRRRRPAIEWPTRAAPEPATQVPVARARKAHLDTYLADDQPLPTDADLLTQDTRTPAPTELAVGTRGDQEVLLRLSGLSLGFTGPGAIGAIRAITTELLAKSSRYRVELVIPEPDAVTLLAETGVNAAELAAALPGLTITPSLQAAMTHLEAEVIHRARLMEEAGQADVPALRTTDPDEPLPALILIATVPATAEALHAILRLGRPYCVGGLLIGHWEADTTVQVTDDGTIIHADGPDADAWTGTELFHLTTIDTSAMLNVLRTATGTLASEAPTIRPEREDPGGHHPAVRELRSSMRSEADAADQTGLEREAVPRPVQLHVLGPVRLYTNGGPITTGLRRITHELLAYLTLNPTGVTREQGIEALMPDRDFDAGNVMWHTAISNARKTLRDATGLREPMYIVHTDGRYRLDRTLIDVDLWLLQAALDRASTADTDTGRIDALRQIPNLYTAELAEDLTFEWAETERERLRRHATDALTYLARLTQDTDPDEALAALEQAINHDPYAEPLYRAIMRMQATAARYDAIRRTYNLLRTRLSEIDQEPEEETHQLLLRSLRTNPAIAHHHPTRSGVGSTSARAIPRDVRSTRSQIGGSDPSG